MDYFTLSRNKALQIEQEEKQGLNRSLALVSWLLITLVVFYSKLDFVTESTNALNVAYISMVFAAIIFAIHYLNVFRLDQENSTILETLVMIGYITLILFQFEGVESPLVSLFFLPIILSASILGRKTAFLETALISAVFLFLTFPIESLIELKFLKNVHFLIQLFPFWLVSYLVSALAGEIRDAKEKILELSHTDSLTGLWNMRMFKVVSNHEFIRSERTSRVFSVLMIDSDNLKPVNDRFGHEAGSLMIRHLGKLIKFRTRESDIAARFGGDEFVILLPETDCESALVAGERLREEIMSTPLIYNNKEITITVSVGIATFPDHGEDLRTVMNCADEALYSSKKAGKNRSIVFQKEV